MKTFSIVTALLLMGVGLMAQQGQFRAELNYTVGLPAGNLKQLADKASFRGGEVAFMYGVTDNASVGLQFGMQDFYQKFPRTIIHESGQDISAVITNSIQVMPIMAKGSWRFGEAGSIQPFVALAAGGNIIQYRKFYGEFSDSRNKFGFAAQPSAGVHVPIGRMGGGLHLAAGFNYMPFKYNDADGLHHGQVKIGASIPLR